MLASPEPKQLYTCRFVQKASFATGRPRTDIPPKARTQGHGQNQTRKQINTCSFCVPLKSIDQKLLEHRFSGFFWFLDVEACHGRVSSWISSHSHARAKLHHTVVLKLCTGLTESFMSILSNDNVICSIIKMVSHRTNDPFLDLSNGRYVSKHQETGAKRGSKILHTASYRKVFRISALNRKWLKV